MNKSYVVIGAGFGDEGKGLMTDYLVRATGAEFVVRFNGGAQAGHTVVDGDKRHVFGHYGAGTFAGAGTIIGSKFIVNPFLMMMERQKLQKLISDSDAISKQRVLVHRKARVSTIYDTLLNQLAELARGEARHGSCGCGINETVTRHPQYSLSAADTLEEFIQVHNRILKEWLPSRATTLGIKLDGELADFVLRVTPQKHAELSYQMLNDSATIMPKRFEVGGSVIMEGAQGLMLDEMLGAFPHVTRSITGLPYALTQASELGIREVTPVYVTRAYSTRHGAGHLLFESNPATVGIDFKDATNVYNEWQGGIRVAKLHLGHLEKFVKADLERGRLIANIDLADVQINEPLLAVTCLDQVIDKVKLIDNPQYADFNDATLCVSGKISHVTHTKDAAPNAIAQRLGIKLGFTSYGPTHRDVKSSHHV